MLSKKDRGRLARCIRHWARLATGTEGRNEGISIEDCALCVAYFNDGKCKGCPISQDTGKSRCRGTPYQNAGKAVTKHGFSSRQFRLRAVSMLEYLIRLDQRL